VSLHFVSGGERARRTYLQVIDPGATPAQEMEMRIGPVVITCPVLFHDHFLDQPVLLQELQGVVNGRPGDGRKGVLQSLIDLLCGGVGAMVVKIFQDSIPLDGHDHPSFLQQIYFFR